MGKVIHVSDELHARIAAHCKSKEVGIKPWAEEILAGALKPCLPAPVEKKPQLQDQGGQLGKQLDIWQQPPFWKGNKKNGLEGNSPDSPRETGKAPS